MNTPNLTKTVRTRVDDVLLRRIQKVLKKSYQNSSQFFREAILEKLNREEKEAA